jgi:hypothetical protein
MTRTVRCPACHRYRNDNHVCPTCGAAGGTIEIVLDDVMVMEDALQGELGDNAGRQHLGFSASAYAEQSWRSTPDGAKVSSVQRKQASRSETEERTCKSAIALIAREIEEPLEYRATTREEDQRGDDGFVCLQRRGSMAVRRPHELSLQVINSNKHAVAELRRHARFESETSVSDLFETTLKMIDLKFDKRHELSHTVLLLCAVTELPRDVLSELRVALTETPRECLGILYIPNVGDAIELQPIDRTRIMGAFGLRSRC